MESSKTVVDVALGIVVRDGQVLVCRRKDVAGDACSGLWEFPGGKCEPGETAAQCAARELLEEVAIEARPHTRLPLLEHDYTSVHVRLHPFLCELVSGTPRAIAAAEVRWVDAAALREFTFPPANDELLPRVIEALTDPTGA